MKIIAITSHYPPFHVGGYEIRCKNVLDALASRGHQIRVLTSSYKATTQDDPSQKEMVFRELHLLDASSSLFKRTWRDYHDVKLLDRLIRTYCPDLVYVWNVINLTKAFFPYLAQQDIPLVCDEGGGSLVQAWQHGGSWYAFLERKSKSRLKNALKAIAGEWVSFFAGGLLKPDWSWPERMTVYFNSHQGWKNALDNHVPVNEAQVIPSGIELSAFPFQPRVCINSPIHILVTGRQEPKKGQKDALFLLNVLRESGMDARLTIVGNIGVASYHAGLKEMVQSLALQDYVMFLPFVTRDQLASLYHQADICFFPSYHQYGLSRTPLEAMACGALVIAYGGEGSGEIILDQETGYIVQAQDYQQMATIIRQNMAQPELYQKVVENARQAVEHFYSLDVYTDKIEAILLDAIQPHG